MGLRGFWPVPSLRYVKREEGLEISHTNANAKLLDVRDAFDYEKGHVPGSINISLGRLPYVWEKELSPDDKVVILAGSRYQSNRAARILHRRGFRQLYAVRCFLPPSPCQERKGFSKAECRGC
ncbi:rhodanese-like domain-containing protein [Gorillibacterium timonense]|uniref:rhodanese-like domain-containing protein n=1 Tax=Gorillibacterium timonense TaxID=1689269 RepID=UPI001F275E37|nr:rhodanese-like domain-containing protein [Gorillibacterium timonense]